MITARLVSTVLHSTELREKFIYLKQVEPGRIRARRILFVWNCSVARRGILAILKVTWSVDFTGVWQNKMRFPAIYSKISVPAAVFYSTFYASKCRADDILGFPWKHDETVHIYKTEVPWTPIEFEEDRNSFAFMAWIAVLSVVICVASMVCLCCVCWKMCRKHNSRRQSSNAALMPSSSEAVVTFQANNSPGADGRNSRTRASNTYSRGIVNIAFTASLQDPVPNLHTEDGPPAYASVISQISTEDKAANDAPYPVVSGTKTVETPPPAYITVAPFQ